MDADLTNTALVAAAMLNLAFVMLMIGPANGTRPLLVGYAVWALLVVFGASFRFLAVGQHWLDALRVVSVATQSGTLIWLILRRH